MTPRTRTTRDYYPEVEWSRLSPRALEINRVVGLRIAAGYSTAEIALLIEASRGDVNDVLELPPEVKAGWVNNRLAQLREAIGESWEGAEPDAAD